MPILNLRLTNTDNSNRCVVELPHEIRTQDMRVKQTRVHFNHEDRNNSVTGNFYNGTGITRSNGANTLFTITKATFPLHAFFLTSNLTTGDVIEYSLASTAAQNDLPLVDPGFYFYEGHKDNGDHATLLRFALHGSKMRAENGNAAGRLTVLGGVTNAAKEHAHHTFRIVSRAHGTDQQRHPSPLKTVYADFKFFSGFEVTSNVSGGGQIPCPIDTTKPVTESDHHMTLAAESVPSSFTVELFEDDGIQPLKLSATEFNAVSEVNIVMEYSTNNLFN